MFAHRVCQTPAEAAVWIGATGGKLMRFHHAALALCAVLALWAVGAPGKALAHPHVWVTVETEIVYDDQKAITGFKYKWTFDEYYSNFAVMGLDTNNDGKYDREELKDLTEVNISSLKEFDYFTFPKLAGKILDREPPKDYRLEYDDGHLVLYLTIPLKTPLPAADVKNFTFYAYDPTYYVDFAFAEKDPVRLSGAPAGCVPVIKNPTPQGPSKITTLAESNLNTLNAATSDAENFAKSVSIDCPAK
jgi:ABC-type uncharacterized transport system substrate-binding protein